MNMTSCGRSTALAGAGHTTLPGSQTTKPYSSGDWSSGDRLLLDLDLPHVVIARALDRGDDAAIWREYACAQHQESFLGVLGTLAGCYSTQQPHGRDPRRNTEWRHELIAVPFLLPAASWPVAAPATADRAGAAALLHELQRWAGNQQSVRIVLGRVTYLDLCRWSPVMQRQHLQLLSRERADLCAPPESLPTEWHAQLPQLAFAIGSVRCWNSPPQLPPPDNPLGGAAWELRARMAASLGYSCQCTLLPQHVLLPSRLREAVMPGLRMWFDELARAEAVQRWDVQPWAKDALMLELGLQARESGRGVLPIRLHQIGCSAQAVVAEMIDRFGQPSYADSRVN